MKKKIKVIIPNSTAEFNKNVRSMLSSVKSPDTELTVGCLNGEGARYLDQKYDEVLSESALLREGENAEREGFDGVMVYCALDPARTALKEALTIPVVFMFETAVHVAAMLGNHFSVICPPGSPASREELVLLYGMERKMVSVEFFDLSIGGLSLDRAASYQIIRKAAMRAVAKGADCLIFGCGAMMGIADLLSAELGIPVLDPGPISLKLCEAMIDLRLRQSKLAYSMPRRGTDETGEIT